MGLLKNKIVLVVVLLFTLATNVCSAQGILKYFISDTTKHRKIFLNWIPFVGYAPETRFAVGAVGIATTHFGHDTVKTHPSSLQLAVIYTQNKQAFIYLPYQLYFKRQKYSLYGELGYYKYNYEFFGIGNGYNPSNSKEEYFVNYPRIRLTALQRFTKIFYAGIKYSYDNFDITQEKVGGELINHTIPGSSGGTISGLGVATIIDSRDNIFFLHEVFILKFLFNHLPPGWVATLITHYFQSMPASISKHFQEVLAFNLYYESGAGTVPFFEMPYIGGENILRGMYEGTYRDNYATPYKVSTGLQYGSLLGVIYLATWAR